ncbi:cysteine proteinase [Laetiporus sulphureus 93-53]|uniref:ubiquitinyl hydrolase 1 n=1 Tax=Laetiporus sulphureus 93-53 TaxID=1314785 RepID=A0A165G846_9APHY|nr:cysteine proteinase [Laetiporus sulphureus 93-53]KZT09960.1 cysteine proteinase [Laetiporus sulphureus 93-53]
MLTPSSQSSSPILSAQDTASFNTRKRQRSQSMSSEPSSSSPKRSVCDDTSQDSPRMPQSQDMSALSIYDSPSINAIDAYMAEQGEDFSSSSAALVTPAQRYEQVEQLSKTPMHLGETWYVVSRSWLKRWRKACSGEVDKEGPVEEKDLGPVDNSDIVSPDDGSIKQTIGPDDYDFVPEKVWQWFVEWYGEPRHPLPRKVIGRGIHEEPTIELHPPRVKVHVLTGAPVPGVSVPPRTVVISVKDTVQDVHSKLPEPVLGADGRAYRIWKLTESSTAWEQMSCTPEQLKQRGGIILEPSQRTVEDEMIEAGDDFVVEYQTDGHWVAEASEVPSQPGISSTSTSQSTIQAPTPRLFSSENDFFSNMQVKSSVAKPALSTTKNGPLIHTRSAKGSSQEPGTLGLGNMGNTCFMNSALQCLAHTKELAEYFLTGVFQEELNPDNPLGMQGAIAEAFGALLQRMWAPFTTSSSYSPREFKQALQRFAPQFSGYQQHDSQELVAFLLDGLHEDLNRVLKKPYVEKPDWEGGGDKELVELANKSWRGYMMRNDSVIVDLFQGQYQSTLVCPECSKVSITFDPFMYLTLPLPVQKKWRHTIYYVPWDTDKPHVQVPVEINRNASFRDLRQLLGRWMDAEPDNLLTLEVFNNRFYKDLNDTVPVGEMTDGDIIVCFELPCHAQQSRTYKPQADDPHIVPVFLCDSTPPRTSYSRQTLFGYPFIVVIDHKQAMVLETIYDAIMDRLQRWTDHARDLFTWEAGTPTSMKPVQIPISGPPEVDSVTEIKENGDIVTVEEPVVEESDITDAKATVVHDQDDIGMEDDIDPEPRKVGFKRDIFKLLVQRSNAKYGIGHGFSGAQRLNSREHLASDSAELLHEADALYCEFDENVKDYFFGDERSRWQHARWKFWEEYIHPEYEASQKASSLKKNKGITIQDCLDEFTREEKLGEDDLWYCPRCKKHQQATKRFDLWKVPDILVVHLKRFSNSRTLRDKIDTFVDFPINGLDISDMVGERQVAQRLLEQGVDIEQLGLSNVDEPLMYDLYAVDEHLGGLGGGHYRAYAYNHVTDKWYHFDDSYVSPTRAEAAVNANAYLLFYRRRTSRPLGGKSHARIEAAQRSPQIMSLTPPDAQSQLPTPPSEGSRKAVSPIFSTLAPRTSTAVTAIGLRPYTDPWATPLSIARSPPASSLLPLDDGELPSFEQAQSDEIVATSLDPLTISAHQFDFPDPSSRNSPTSSLEAAADLEEFDKDVVKTSSLEAEADLEELDKDVVKELTHRGEWRPDVPDGALAQVSDDVMSDSSQDATSPSSSSVDDSQMRSESEEDQEEMQPVRLETDSEYDE